MLRVKQYISFTQKLFLPLTQKDRLPTGKNGLLILYGKAMQFLDIFITVLRIRKESNKLGILLQQYLQFGVIGLP